jgi:hypothetical protein
MGIPKILKKILPQNWLYDLELKRQHKIMIGITEEEWRATGCNGAAPSTVKWATMKEYAEKYGATHFVETGTFMGDTSYQMKDVFKQVDTIELDEKLALKAQARFADFKNVKVWVGDSGEKIDDILRGIPSKTISLFWLDGHFSGGITAKADLNTPISKELEKVLKHNKNHVILIDDARLFYSGEEDYPPMEEIEKQIKIYNPTAKIEVKDDIIRVTSF